MKDLVDNLKEKLMLKNFKKKTVAVGLLAAVACLGLHGAVAPSWAAAKPDLDACFDFEPHRGGRDARPENTLYAYAYAIEMGATSIECDMQLTADGRIVMSHNPILNHEITRDKDGRFVEDGRFDIRTMTVEQIKRFDVSRINPDTPYYQIHGTSQVVPESAEIPTLEELLQLIKDSGRDVYLNIETKSYPDREEAGYANNPDPKKFVKVFYDTVKKYGMEDKVILQSFDWATLIEMKKLDANIATSALWCQQPSWGRGGEYLRPFEKEKSPWLGGLDIKEFQNNPVEAAHAIKADVVSPYYTEITKDDVDLAHKYGMKVVPWTVNNVQDMEMLYAMGVDGMISDKPWILRAFLEKKGAKLNPVTKVAVQKYHLEPNHIDTEENKRIEGGLDAAY